MISRSFERPDRTVSRASDARNRYKIRYTRTQYRPAPRQVNDHGRVSDTHTHLELIEDIDVPRAELERRGGLRRRWLRSPTVAVLAAA